MRCILGNTVAILIVVKLAYVEPIFHVISRFIFLTLSQGHHAPDVRGKQSSLVSQHLLIRTKKNIYITNHSRDNVKIVFSPQLFFTYFSKAVSFATWLCFGFGRRAGKVRNICCFIFDDRVVAGGGGGGICASAVIIDRSKRLKQQMDFLEPA
jgi:hypothetical protein